MDTLSDHALIQAVLEGDLRAYEQLVLRHQDMVAHFVWRIVPQEQDREEVCQDVFLKVYLSLHKFRFESKFSTWLYSIAYRVAISSVRRRKHAFDDTTPVEPAGDPLDADAMNAEISRLIAREIDKLSLDERSIVTLFHIQEFSIDDIAAIVGKPPGTIKSLLFRARMKIKDQLIKRLDWQPSREVAL